VTRMPPEKFALPGTQDQRGTNGRPLILYNGTRSFTG